MVSRHQPLKLPGGLRLKNRLVVPPMASGTANEDGTSSPRTLAHYKRLARAGAGLTFVEYTYVHGSGRSEKNQLGLDSDRHAEALAPVARALKAAGTVPGLQLTHGGGKSTSGLTSGRLIGPSDVRVPVKDRTLEAPRPMTPEEVSSWVQWFADAAVRGAHAGFEVIELHAAHGYGFNQWLSSLTNRRTDTYGGDLQGRSRILLETVREIKKRLPRITVAVRLPGRDFLEGGLAQSDSLWIARSLIREGVDLIDVSSGLGGWRRPADRVGQGYLIPEAAYLQQRLTGPVIGVGGIESGSFIDKILASGSVSLAAVGRAILKDPDGWKENHMSKRVHSMEASPARAGPSKTLPSVSNREP